MYLYYIMQYTIVYKTYKNDIGWLKYSLLSLHKYMIDDIFEIIIYYHDICYEQLANMLKDVTIKYNIRLIPVNYDIHGYLKQMVVKCMSFKDVTTDYIVFIDSDVIFKKSYYLKDHFDNDKLKWYILKKNSNNKNYDEWKVWGNSIKKMTNTDMNIYYMYNGFPFVVKKDTLKDAYNKFLELHNKDYHSFCKFYLDNLNIIPSMPITGPTGKFMEMAGIFEEFEYMGYYAHNFTNDYIFIENPNSNSSDKVIQYWSHGTLTSTIEKEILDILQ